LVGKCEIEIALVEHQVVNAAVFYQLHFFGSLCNHLRYVHLKYIMVDRKLRLSELDIETQKLEKKLKLTAKIIAVQEDVIEKARQSNEDKNRQVVEME
jgi:hypothetical protein